MILRGTGVGDGTVATLAGLTALTTRALGGCPVTDRGVESLAGMTGLHSLELSGTGVGDGGMAAVGRPASLESLSLDGLPVPDRGAAALARLVHLRSLSLHNTRVGGDRAAWLAGLKRPGLLTLSGTAVTDDALRHPAGCDELINLRLDKTGVTGRGLAHLPGRLWHRSRSGVRLDDDDLAALGRLASLRSLILDAAAVADGGLATLEAMNLARRPAWGEEVAVFERLPCCPLCRRPIRDGEPVFCTRPYTPPDPDLFAFARVPLHWGCYAAWEPCLRFARHYFEAQAGWAEGNQFWGVARKDDAVLVSVNPSKYVGEADVILAATGSSLRVPLADWEEWLAGGWFDGCTHEAEGTRSARSSRRSGSSCRRSRASWRTREWRKTPETRLRGPNPAGWSVASPYEFACQKLAARRREGCGLPGVRPLRDGLPVRPGGGEVLNASAGNHLPLCLAGGQAQLVRIVPLVPLGDHAVRLPRTLDTQATLF